MLIEFSIIYYPMMQLIIVSLNKCFSFIKRAVDNDAVLRPLILALYEGKVINSRPSIELAMLSKKFLLFKMLLRIS